MKALRFILGGIIFLITLGVLAALVGSLYFYQEFHKNSVLEQSMTIEILQGAGLNQIAYRLEEDGIIQNRFIFIAGARIYGAANDLKAGEYKFEPGVTPKSALEKIRTHDVIMRFITIPEGLTSYEIVRLLNGIEDLSGEVTEIPAEGSLLPETYDYQRAEQRSSIIARMQNAMKDTQKTLIAQYCPDGLQSCSGGLLKDKNDLNALAAIIEKETSVPEERRRVAGVFMNRLKKGMALQTDPTVIYAITKGKHENEGKGPLGRRLLRKDLAIDSPYNTYKFPGLTPGPIANPGRASIEAALNPEDHDYLYFVADGTGGHAFGRTLAEHNQNVAKWRKIRRKSEN